MKSHHLAVRPSILALALVVVTAIVLRSFGQPWWCACGSAIPWTWETISSHNSQHLFDAYSFTHVTHGLIFFALLFPLARRISVGWRFALAISIECGWEILENTSWIIDRYRAATISLNYYGDSVLNSISDIGACAIGFYIAAKVPWKLSLALFIATEIVLVLTIRDNLAINILMLIYPVDAIKIWQQGAAVGL